MAAERLLESLSMILTGQPFRSLGAPALRYRQQSRDYALLQVSGTLRVACPF